MDSGCVCVGGCGWGGGKGQRGETSGHEAGWSGGGGGVGGCVGVSGKEDECEGGAVPCEYAVRRVQERERR